MKKTKLLMIAASCLAIALLGCEKEGPTSQSIKPGSDGRSVAWTSLADLIPNYVYTLVGNPDKYEQIDGVGDQASFTNIDQLIADDGYLYAADGYQIRRINIADRTVTTLAGNKSGGASRDGFKEEASFLLPGSIALGPDGSIYVADFVTVRKVTKEGRVTTIAGSTGGYQDGPAKDAKFRILRAITVCKDGTIYVVDDMDDWDDKNMQIRKISSSGVVSTVTSGGPDGPNSSWTLTSLAFLDGALYASGKGLYKFSSTGEVTTIKKDMDVASQSLLPMHDGSFFITVDNQILKLSATGSATPVAGIPVTDLYARPAEGPADSVDLHHPYGFTLYNNVLYIPVHPAFPELESPYSQQGHVIQMMALPK